MTDSSVAIVPWGLVLEDFLTPNRLTLDDFCDQFTGSWMFGYADALRETGIRPLIVCVASGVATVTRRTHGPTGTEICLLPPPRAYRALRRLMRDPYGRTVARTFRGPRPVQLPLLPLLFVLKEIAPYLATPVRALAGELTHYGCRIVLCQEYEFPRFDVLVEAGRRHGFSVFGVFQGGDYRRWRVERLVRPATVRRACGLIVGASTEVERAQRQYRPRRIGRIPNPLDLGVWRPHDREEIRNELGVAATTRVAAWHGRIDIRTKGLDVLLSAWACVSERTRDSLLLLIGTGADTAAVTELIEGLGLDNVRRVDRYVHDRGEIAHLLSAADVYVFTSRREGFPVAPAEAIACGLPVVGSDVPGMRDVIGDGGIVVPREDAERTAEEIVRIFADDDLRERLAAAAHARAQLLGARAVGSLLRDFLFGAPPTR